MRAFLSYLQANQGETAIGQETCRAFGLRSHKDQDRAIRAMIDAGLITKLNTGKRGNRQTRRFRANDQTPCWSRKAAKTAVLEPEGPVDDAGS